MLLLAYGGWSSQEMGYVRCSGGTSLFGPEVGLNFELDHPLVQRLRHAIEVRSQAVKGY